MLHMFSMVLLSQVVSCFPGSAVWEIKPTQSSSPVGACLQAALSCVRLCQTVALVVFFLVCPVAGAGFHGGHSKCMSV